MRYFLISYFYKENNGNNGIGNITLKYNKFPSHSQILRHTIFEKLTVLSIFEFKNELDYLEYNSK